MLFGYLQLNPFYSGEIMEYEHLMRSGVTEHHSDVHKIIRETVDLVKTTQSGLVSRWHKGYSLSPHKTWVGNCPTVLDVGIREEDGLSRCFMLDLGRQDSS